MEQQTRATIAAVRNSRDSCAMPPPLEDSPKCWGCSLCGICLPDETRELRDAAFGSTLKTGELPDFDESNSNGCAMKTAAKRALPRAWEQRLDQVFTHPEFAYSAPLTGAGTLKPDLAENKTTSPSWSRQVSAFSRTIQLRSLRGRTQVANSARSITATTVKFRPSYVKKIWISYQSLVKYGLTPNIKPYEIEEKSNPIQLRNRRV